MGFFAPAVAQIDSSKRIRKMLDVYVGGGGRNNPTLRRKRAKGWGTRLLALEEHL